MPSRSIGLVARLGFALVALASLLAAPLGCGGMEEVAAADAGPDSCVTEGVLTTGGALSPPVLTTALGDDAFYWFAFTPGAEAVQGVDKCGGAAFQVTSGISATDSSEVGSGPILSLAADGQAVYFTDVSSEGVSLVAVPQRGGAPVTIAGPDVAFGPIAVDSTDVYWPSVSGAILARPAAGGPIRTVATTESVQALGVNATDVVWLAAKAGSRVSRLSVVPKAGGSVRTIVSATPFSGLGTYPFAVDDAHAYYVAALGDAEGLYSAPLDGGSPTLLASARAPFVNASGDQATWIASIAVDDASVYFCEPEGAIRKVSKQGGPTQTLLAGDGTTYPRGLQVDATSVYWLDADGTVRKVPK